MMKRIMITFNTMLLIISLPACSPDFNRSRVGDSNQLVMEYATFNITDSRDLIVEAGDTVHVEIVIEDGHLSYKIQKDGDGPIAEGESTFFPEELGVKVKESGTYTVAATGEEAKGSIKFVVENAE